MRDAAAWIIKQIEQKMPFLSSESIMIASGCICIYAPQIVNDLNGNPEFIVGNSSDVLGDYKLVKIPITKLRYFPIIGESGELPVNPEVDNAIDGSYLADGPLAILEHPRIVFLNTWLVSFEGKKAPL